jgi:hypothetical protein
VVDALERASGGIGWGVSLCPSLARSEVRMLGLADRIARNEAPNFVRLDGLSVYIGDKRLVVHQLTSFRADVLPQTNPGRHKDPALAKTPFKETWLWIVRDARAIRGRA